MPIAPSLGLTKKPPACGVTTATNHFVIPVVDSEAGTDVVATDTDAEVAELAVVATAELADGDGIAVLVQEATLTTVVAAACSVGTAADAAKNVVADVAAVSLVMVAVSAATVAVAASDTLVQLVAAATVAVSAVTVAVVMVVAADCLVKAVAVARVADAAADTLVVNSLVPVSVARSVAVADMAAEADTA